MVTEIWSQPGVERSQKQKLLGVPGGTLAPLGKHQPDLPRLRPGPGPTCADKHDVIDGAIQGLGPVHHDLCVVHIALDQPGPVVDGDHGVVHQGVVFYKLQCLVWQVEGAGEVGRPGLAVDALQGADCRCKPHATDSPTHSAQSPGLPGA